MDADTLQPAAPPRPRQLPVPVEPDEQLLWTGTPAWRAVAVHVYHIRLVAAYFTVLTLIDMVIIREGVGIGWPVVTAAVPTVVTGATCVLILAVLAYATQRTTTYTLTTRRIIMRFGVALPATLAIPLHRITATAIRVRGDQTGDITLRLCSGHGLMFLKLWPHVRPWRLFAPEPMLRDLPDAAMVAPLLCRALAAARQQSPVSV